MSPSQKEREKAIKKGAHALRSYTGLDLRKLERELAAKVVDATRFEIEASALEAMADEAEKGNYHGELVWVWLRNVAQMIREDTR